MKTIQVKIVQILWPRLGVENRGNWYRLECLAEQGRLVCTGNIKWRPVENELLKLTGEFEAYKGQQQFKFREVRPFVPEDSRARLAYVVERTKDMGPAKEAAIWEKLGDGWAKITPEQAEELKIRPDVFEIFKQQIEQTELNQDKCDTITYLVGRGCTNALACAAWEAWELDAVGIVNADCYRLADLSGFGFADVDGRVRFSYEIGDDDPRRIKAAILYVMRQLTNDGSTVISAGILESRLRKMGIDIPLAQQRINAMFEDFTLRGFPNEQMIALGVHYNAESEILKLIEDNHD